MDILSGLNDRQQEAVRATEGPVLIIAGAGSGKTRVLTHRIAWLISEKQVNPSNILAFTFTNKAASEMKERIIALVKEESRSIWIGTFHSTCVRILRQDIENLGFARNFAIYDVSDQKSLMSDCLKELNINNKIISENAVLHEIGRAKDELIEPDTFRKIYENDFRMSRIAEIYELYQKKLRENNALDFDDIILFTIKLFREKPAILRYYQQKFRYIHVDEYQDTNTAQYHLISLLAQGHRNLCVVGDEDQSIYGFRGANIRNILDFEKEFPECRVIKLEQNYRSTRTILDAANSVISNNTQRKDKTLWTGNDTGCGIRCIQVENEHEEAAFVAGEIRGLTGNEGYRHRDIAVLYRTNAQSRVFEDIFRMQGIPYKIIAGLSFYQRREIKDVNAYLRVIYNPSGNIDIKRIINVPRRGIGAATVEKVEEIARQEGRSIFDVISNARNYPELQRAASKLESFAKMINSLRRESRELSISGLIKAVINKTGIARELEEESTSESLDRLENINELVSYAMEFENNPEREGTLEEFLQNISLASETDDIDEENSVLMLTLHSAKGLEFPVVFMVGLEEGLFPGYRAIGSESELEEERRLCYVGMTRAREVLYLTNSRCRTLYGKTSFSMPSRFIGEVPENLMEDVLMNRAGNGRPFATSKSRHHWIPAEKSSFEKSPPGKSPFEKSQSEKSPFGAVIYRGSTPININDLFKKDRTARSFKTGDRVKHGKFGMGTVTGVTPVKDDYALEIEFDKSGFKRLMASFANLEKAD